jgi:hypothetical protein
VTRFGFDADAVTWLSFVAANQQPCLCGHPKIHHRGFAEPGCSYAGACPCLRFRLGDAD